MADEVQPIIIIKKKGGHGGHHGGAWKVAYADFVTAMMALFIVLWLLNTSEDVQKAIGAYFNDPTGVGKEQGSGQAGSGETLNISSDNMDKLKEKLDQALKESPDFEQLKDHIQMMVTGEGLRVEMLESEKGMFFKSGSAVPSNQGEEVIDKLAQELGRLPNEIVIEGHTDAKPFGLKASYSNWELSSDRANAARRQMEMNGLRPGQVVQVRGFADHNLRDPANPLADSNRRVSIIIRYLKPQPGAGGETKGGEGKQGEHATGEGGEATAATGEHGQPAQAQAQEPAKAPTKEEHH